ncbi:TraY domain-containing protein [Vibrio ichthyoenteri]|nr:TraY domain-containing protein [Vibrio ichthyoenteri]
MTTYRQINVALSRDYVETLNNAATCSYRSLRSETTLRIEDYLGSFDGRLTDEIDEFIFLKKDIGTYITCSLTKETNENLNRLVSKINDRREKPTSKSIIAGCCLAYHLTKYLVIGCKGFKQ